MTLKALKNILVGLIFVGIGIGCNSSQSSNTVVIKTSLGDIEVELYTDKAPVTTSNFMHYVNTGAYNGSSFFRTCTPANEALRNVKIEVIQGGNVDDSSKLLVPIVIETTRQTGLKHLDGTISMARDTPNSAQSSFFICIGDQPSLDFGGARNPDGQGFAAFGRVAKGMDVVKTIQAQADTNQYMINPVAIYSIQSL